MTRTTSIAPLPRIGTGIARLDAVLGGGIPTGSITVLAGEPGSGKTVLALQMVCAAARLGQRCLYFTTLSEPAIKLVRYMQRFDYFDAALLERQVVIADLGSVLRTDGAEAALAQLIERVEQEEPALMVIDSFKALHDLVRPERQRSFVYDLAVTMTGWNATTLLLGEYAEADIAALPEFAIADGIVRVGLERAALDSVRTLEVRKLRGSGFVSGVHYFAITPHGIDFVPRVRAPEIDDEQSVAIDTPRVATGVAGVDRLLRGGWLAGSATVVVGGTGTGKSILGLSFLVEGARRGEPGVLLALEETPGQIRAHARAFGWDIEDYEARGLIAIQYTAPIEISTDRFLHESRAFVAQHRARRLVLDSLSSLALGAVSERRFKEIVYALTKHLRGIGVTSMMNLEVAELLGAPQLSGHGLSFAADNVLYLRYTDFGGRLARALAVIKARGMEHDTRLCEMTIGAEGIVVTESANGLQDVLSNVALHGAIRASRD